MSAEDALRKLAAAGENDLPKLLLRAARVTSGQLVEHLGAHGHGDVRPPHAGVFAHLDAEGTRISILAQRADMTRQGMSALVQDLQALGYVESQPDPTDRRAAIVSLTQQGETLCHEVASSILDELEDQWRALLGPQRLKELRESLRLLAGADGDLPGGD